MEFISVPIIVVCCYIVGEFIKIIFKNNPEAHKAIPLVVTILGGVMGGLIYLTNPELIGNVNDFLSAVMIGFVSGGSATGTNQIIKKLFGGQNDDNK